MNTLLLRSAALRRSVTGTPKPSQKKKSHHPSSETTHGVCAESREIAAAYQLFGSFSWSSRSVLGGFCWLYTN